MKDKKILDYLEDIGIRPDLSGFKYSYAMIEESQKTFGKDEIIRIWTLYDIVAKRFGTSISKVERAIRHARQLAGIEQRNGHFIAQAVLEVGK